MANFEAHQQVIPVIDIHSLLEATDEINGVRDETVRLIGEACRHVGFFYIAGHQVPVDLQEEMVELSTIFFALPKDVKSKIDMKFGGKAWRGFFCVGDEFTSGIPDQKEGIYFGTELSSEDPRYLHGPNLWPDFDDNLELAKRFRTCITAHMAHMKRIGFALMSAIVSSLGITATAPSSSSEEGAVNSLTFAGEPTELFRIFNYPPHDERFGDLSFGVGEHTDYGYITILKQDNSGGLQIKRTTLVSQSESESDSSSTSEQHNMIHTWIEAPPIDNTFVINLGDALERLTGGLYRATPHRVAARKGATSNRLSFPYFFDPSFDHTMVEVSAHLRVEDVAIAHRNRLIVASRWDKADPTQFQGTYGEYLLRKVSKVFPELASKVNVTV